VYEDLNPKMGKILDFMEFVGFFQHVWIFWTLFGLFRKKKSDFFLFSWILDFFSSELYGFFGFFQNFLDFWHRFFGVYENFFEWTTPRL